MLAAKAHRPYSWWWDSHLSPKNSKWLQENLTDMDSNIKAMLKLIEEDADSFAKRAEMFYKKRPELVHLVEEFYRAYRALAERYDHISGELRQVHYTIAEAFPNQMQHVFHGDFPQASFLEWASDQSFESPLKTKNIFDIEEMQKTNSGQKVASPVQMHNRAVLSPNATEDASEVAKSQGVKEVNEIITEKRSLEKMVLHLQEELSHVQNEKQKMKEDSISQIEQINSLKEQLFSFKNRNKNLDEEGHLQTENKEHQNVRTEIKNLKVGMQNSNQGSIEKEIQSVDFSMQNGARDNKSLSLQDEFYQQQLQNNRLRALVMEGVQQVEKAEEEAQTFHMALSKSHEENESLILQYRNDINLLQTSENREKNSQVRLAIVEEENKKLKDELAAGALHLKVMEEKADNIKNEKNAVQLEMGRIIQKTSFLIEELTSMRKEEQNLRMRLQDETAESRRIDTALKSCQQALIRSQEQQKLLTAEIQVETERLKDANKRIKFLEGEISQLQNQNGNMVEQISSTSMSIENLEEEISKLKQEQIVLLNEVAFRVDQRNALQQELYCLQEERNDLDRRFQTIKKQIEQFGLDPKNLESSIVSLQEDNHQLRELCRKYEDEHLIMVNIAKRMDEELVERNKAVEELVSSHTKEVERLKDDMTKLKFLLQESHEEKLTLIAESKQQIKQTNNLETSLHDFQKRVSQLEIENLDLKGELKNTLGHVEHLNGQLHFSQSEKEKTEYEITACHTQISDLEKQVCLLQADGNDLRTKMQEETENQKKAQVEIGRLQQLLDQMEERNITLSDECQKHIGEFIAVEERVTELEREIHIQKSENISLVDNLSLERKFNKELKVQIHKLQNLLAVPGIEVWQAEGADVEGMQLFVNIIEKVKFMQSELLHVEEANKRLSIVASVMSTYVEQFKTCMSVVQSEKNSLHEAVTIRSQHLEKLQKELFMLQHVADSLRIQLQLTKERERDLEEETKNLQHSLASSENSRLILQDEHQRTLQNYGSVKAQIVELQGRFSVSEQESQIFLSEVLTQISLETVLERNIAERDGKIQQLMHRLKKLDEEKKDLKNEVQVGSRKLQMLEVEVQHLLESIQSFEDDKRHADALQNELSLLNAKFGRMNLQLETDSCLIKEKDTMLGELRQRLQVVEEENKMLAEDLEIMQKEHSIDKMSLNKLRLQVSSMTEEINHLIQSETNLEEEMKNLQHSLVSSHDGHLLLQDEHQKTLQDYNSIRTQIDQLQDRFCVAEQENTMFILEALTKMSLLTVLENNIVERDENVQQLVERLNKLDKEKMELENKVQTGVEKLQMLEIEVQKLHEVIQRFTEEKRHADTLQSELMQQLQAVNKEKMTLLDDLESINQEYATVEMTVNELRLQVCSLKDDNIHLKQDLSDAEKDKTKANEELHGMQREREILSNTLSSTSVQEKKLQNDVLLLQEKEVMLRTQLQDQTEEATVLELEVEGLYEVLQSTQIENILLKDARQKIYHGFKLLETRTWEFEEELLCIEEEKKKQGAEAAAQVAQIKELERNITDLETGKKSAGAKAATIFSQIAPLKQDLCTLKDQILGQMNVEKIESHKLEDRLLKWLRDAMDKLQETNMELSVEAQNRAYELQKMQADIEHIVTEHEKKNQTLKDESHRTIAENSDFKTRLANILSGNSHLESENRSLKMEIQEHIQNTGQLQEERKVIEDKLHLQVTEVESLKAELEETKELQKHILKLLELVVGPGPGQVLLNKEKCQLAEDKLKEIHQEIFSLKCENEKLKDNSLRMSCEIDNLEAALGFKYKVGINDDPLQSYSHGIKLKQKIQQIEARNGTPDGSIQWELNEEGDQFLTLEKGCKTDCQNGVIFEKEKIFLEGYDVEVPDSYVCKDKGLRQPQESIHDLDSMTGGNDTVLEDFEHFQDNTRLENQVQELSEKAKIFDVKSLEAQDLAMKLAEVQPALVNTQKLKEKIKELQARVKNLQLENIQLKGERTYSSTMKFEELSHSKEADLFEVESLELQEEKEVVVDEAKAPAHTNDIGELDILQEENRKYWGRLDFVNKKTKNLQNAIQELQQRLKSVKQKNKKLKDDRWYKGIDYNSLEKQLKEHQGQIKQLVEHNNRLRKDVKYVFACISRIQEDTSGREHKSDEETLIACQQNAKIAERLESGSEKARVLEMEVQRIRLTLSRFQQQVLDDGPKTRVPLRTFLVGSSRKERPPKQPACCACMHPPAVK